MGDKLNSLRNSPEFAEEKLVASVQSLLQQALEERGMSRSDLAKKMGVSKARISQMFSDSQNFTLRLVAAAFFALGEEIKISRPTKLEFKSMDGGDCDHDLSFERKIAEITHGFEWLGEKSAISIQPMSREIEMGPETRESINRTIKTVLKECLVADKIEDEIAGSSVADRWAKSGDTNVIQAPFGRKKVS